MIKSYRLVMSMSPGGSLYKDKKKQNNNEEILLSLSYISSFLH